MSIFLKANSKGEVYNGPGYQVLFGNDRLKISDLTTHYPKISQLKQVHGCNIAEGSQKTQEADGHYTTQKNLPLIIRTADCMPVLIHSPSKIYALHIGWRGLAQKFLSRALEKMPNKSDLTMFLGPHIHRESFRINENITHQLLSAHNLNIKKALQKGIVKPNFDKTNHFNLSLKNLLIKEWTESSNGQTVLSLVDTYNSPTHYSHRRHNWRLGHNISMIVKTNE